MWVREYPSLLQARCHYIENRFGVEEIEGSSGGTFSFFDWHQQGIDLEEFLEIMQKIDTKLSRGKDFSEEEWECFLNEGFLGVLRMRAPELQENKLFKFHCKLNSTIEELEEKFQERPYSEVLQEIKAHIKGGMKDHLDKRDYEDYIIWKAIFLKYDEDYFWVMDKENGTGGIREEYVNYLRMLSKEKEAKRTKQHDTAMDLYPETGKPFKNEHTAQEIGEAVKDTVTQKSIQDALTNITGSRNTKDDIDEMDQ